AAGAARACSRLTRHRHDVLGLGALGSLGGLELDLRTLGERLVAVAGDGRVVDEEILAAAVVRGDEPVTLGIVEPLHCSCSHEKTPPLPTPERQMGGFCRPSISSCE